MYLTSGVRRLAFEGLRRRSVGAHPRCSDRSPAFAKDAATRPCTYMAYGREPGAGRGFSTRPPCLDQKRAGIHARSRLRRLFPSVTLASETRLEGGHRGLFSSMRLIGGRAGAPGVIARAAQSRRVAHAASGVVAPRRCAGQPATVRRPLVVGARPVGDSFHLTATGPAACSRQDVARRPYSGLRGGWRDVASSHTLALLPTHLSDQTSLRRPPSRRVSEARGTGGNSPAGGLAMEGQAFLTRHGCLVEKPLTAPGSRP